MSKVVVFGGSGMLGSMLVDVLSRNPSLAVTATVRSAALAERCREKLPKVSWRIYELAAGNQAQLIDVIQGAAWIINAIGVIKSYIHNDDSAGIERAIRINALFPHELAQAAAQTGARILQIATDCVYSGLRGAYTENDAHDALDVYGKTKSLGESFLGNVHNLRCSIVGPEPKEYVSLLEWFRRQPHRAKVAGYTNHQWNGLTTLQFAKLCRGIIRSDMALPHVQHVVPAGPLSKADLLEIFAREFKRDDIEITPGPAKVSVDRTLATIRKTSNEQLWEAAGYARIPSVAEMVAELAAFDYQMGAL
jgi:dTDP-4-dehydrorhamnose reductase